jgi:hypothetical protein
MIREPIAKAPGPNATAQDREEYREARDTTIIAQTLMESSMESSLKTCCQHHDLYTMINALKNHFAPQVRKQKYDCVNEFFTTKMKENTCIKSHVSNMQGSTGAWLTNLNTI